jgi:hypothetical protein
MPYIGTGVTKIRTDDPFRVPAEGKRSIVVLAGTKWPTGVTGEDDYTIPLGTPMCPPTAGTGAYKPIRRAVVVTAATAGEAICNVGALKAVGFAVGDVVNILQNGATPALMTVSTVGTISTINYATGVITLTNGLGLVVSVGCFVEVAENGAATNPNSAVYLGENIRTYDDTVGAVNAIAVGYISGQVRAQSLSQNCFDSLTAKQMPNFDFIPNTPGL